MLTQIHGVYIQVYLEILEEILEDIFEEKSWGNNAHKFKGFISRYIWKFR